jgi:hypothetical protein
VLCNLTRSKVISYAKRAAKQGALTERETTSFEKKQFFFVLKAADLSKEFNCTDPSSPSVRIPWVKVWLE